MLTPKERKFIVKGAKPKSNAEYQMLHRIRRKVKSAFADLTLLAQTLPEKQQRRLFTPENVIPLIESILCANVDWNNWGLTDLIKRERQFRLARQIWTRSYNIEKRLRQPLDKAHREFLAFELALIKAGLNKNYDAERFLKDGYYRRELYEKLKRKQRKTKIDYFEEAKKELAEI